MFLFFILSIATLTLAENDPVTYQLEYFKERNQSPVGIITTSNGAPVTYNEATSTLNTKLIYNRFFMDTMSHLVRERIPERTVHAKGAGAFGYFEVTNNISHICKADFLKKVGEKTPVAVRFSPSTGERGFSDLNRDTRGLAFKLYTRKGNFDLVCFNTEMYFYKDPLYFHPFVHSPRRNPSTNLRDPKMLWDAISLRPETMHLFLLMFADRGIPASYRNTPAFALHLYQVENSSGKNSYIKFHILPDAGIKNLGSEEARNISGTDPDYHTRDLYRAIAKGDYPSWTVYGQILSDDDVKCLGSRAWDLTRIIPTKDFPLQEIGKIVLNRNPKNYFAEIEQMAFSPGNLVPGILGSPDRVFESRIFAYKDAHMYRLGANADRIPVNCPYRVETHYYDRDGNAPVNNNEGDAPNYYPNSFNGPVPLKENKTKLVNIEQFNYVDNFDQASEFYENLEDDEKTRLIVNVVENLSQVTDEIQQRIVKLFNTINAALGNRVSKALKLSTCS